MVATASYDPTASLDSKAITVVIQSWEQLKIDPNFASILGDNIFGEFFRLAPHAMELFPFACASIEEIYQDPIFRAHSRRVLETFDYIVASLMDLERNYLVELGERHNRYPGVSPEYFDPLSEAILLALQSSLRDKWDDKLREAWIQVIAFLASSMSEGMNKKSKVALLKTNDSGLPTVALNSSAITAVMKSWEHLKMTPGIVPMVGNLIFGKFFQDAPNAMALFPFDCESIEELYKDSAFQAHSERVLETFDYIVVSLMDLEREFLVELGQRHTHYPGVNPEYFGPLSVALLFALETCMQDIWNDELRDAWNQLIRFLASGMSEG